MTHLLLLYVSLDLYTSTPRLDRGVSGRRATQIWDR